MRFLESLLFKMKVGYKYGKVLPKIIGDAVYLSPMSLDDLEQYTRWMNDLEMTKYLGAAATTISLEKERKPWRCLQKASTTLPLF